MFYKLKETTKRTDELIRKFKQEEQNLIKNSKKDEIEKLKQELEFLKAENERLEEIEKKVCKLF